MTNSPPPNVKHWPEEAGRVLASGIDSLVLAINVSWKSDALFEQLAALKERAKKAQDEEPVLLTLSADSGTWVFNVKPHGAGGYEWILASRELTMKIGNWKILKQRPSLMVDIRAETLWTHGPEAVIERVGVILHALGAVPVSVKPSRADLARDILIADENWSRDLVDSFVTRAESIAIYLKHRKLSGFTIGSDKMLVRIYDKALEIRKSKKLWMYNVWQIPDVPQGHRAIRVELQMRRAVLHSLGGDSWEKFRSRLPDVWAYGTQKWLRVVDDAELHHTQQIISPWWLLIMADFAGMQSGEPLIRKKAIQQDLLQLAAQTLGTLSSIATIVTNDATIQGDTLLDVRSHTEHALRIARDVARLTDKAFTERVKKKHAKYARQPASTSQKRKNRARVNRVLNDEGGNG